MGIFKRGKGEENLDIGEIERRGGDGFETQAYTNTCTPHLNYTSHAHHHKASQGATTRSPPPHELLRSDGNNTRQGQATICYACMHGKEEKQ